MKTFLFAMLLGAVVGIAAHIQYGAQALDLKEQASNKIDHIRR